MAPTEGPDPVTKGRCLKEEVATGESRRSGIGPGGGGGGGGRGGNPPGRAPVFRGWAGRWQECEAGGGGKGKVPVTPPSARPTLRDGEEAKAEGAPTERSDPTGGARVLEEEVAIEESRLRGGDEAARPHSRASRTLEHGEDGGAKVAPTEGPDPVNEGKGLKEEVATGGSRRSGIGPGGGGGGGGRGEGVGRASGEAEPDNSGGGGSWSRLSCQPLSCSVVASKLLRPARAHHDDEHGALGPHGQGFAASP